MFGIGEAMVGAGPTPCGMIPVPAVPQQPQVFTTCEPQQAGPWWQDEPQAL